METSYLPFGQFIAVISAPLFALVSAVILWFLNERGKRQHALHIEKMKLYEKLLRSIEGFYVGSPNPIGKQHFVNEISVAWMFSSDEVIDKAYRFLETVKAGNLHSDQEKETALADFIKSIRKDMGLKIPVNSFKPWKLN